MAAEIVPSIIDAFIPTVNVSVAWTKASAEYGNSIKPAKLKKTPHVHLHEWPTFGDSSQQDQDLLNAYSQTQLTVVLTDPDAPSHDDPKWSQVCHWIVTRLPIRQGQVNYDVKFSYKEIVKYKKPGPPAKTGPHRYVLVALAPLNGTTAKLHLVKPKERQHWGYDGDRAGVREWAAENGLGVIGKHIMIGRRFKSLQPVGANFFYAEHEKQ